MIEITKETIISDILNEAPEAAPIFQSMGMGCMGCVMASGENVEQACAVHGIDANALVAKLNEFVKNA